MTRVEVVAVDECATCKGEKRVVTSSKMNGGTFTIAGDCPTCGGTGETRTVVSCGGCRHFGISTGAGVCLPLRKVVTADWACASWQGKEPQ